MQRRRRAITAIALLTVLVAPPAVSACGFYGNWRGHARRQDGKRNPIVFFRVFTITAGAPGPLLQGLSGRYDCVTAGIACPNPTAGTFGGTIEEHPGTASLTIDLTVRFRTGASCIFSGVLTTSPIRQPERGDRASGTYACTSRKRPLDQGSFALRKVR